MQKNRNHNKQSLRPQCNKIRTQDEETNSKPHNLMERKQLAPERQLDKQWIKGKNKDVLQNQQEQRHNVPESLGHMQSSVQREIIATNAHMRSWEVKKDLKLTP